MTTLSAEAKKERNKEYDKRYLEKNQEARKQSLKTYRNKPEAKQKRKEWLDAHAEQYAASKLLWSQNNPSKVKANTKMHRENNPGFSASHCAKRRSKKLTATPNWVGSEEQWLIKEAYSLAALRSKMFGFKWHVDHVVPLQGTTVCGLHTVENLQVIPWTDNIKKHNKWQPQ